MDLAAPADPWTLLRRVVQTSLSSAMFRNVRSAGATRELSGMVSDELMYHAHLLVGLPGLALS